MSVFCSACALETVARALGSSRHGAAAAQLAVAEQYVAAFHAMAKETNTVLLPSNPGDIGGMVEKVFFRSADLLE